jgi:murein endopeptidase
MRWSILFLLIFVCIQPTFASTSYATCTYCSLIDEAWKVAGNSQVYVPGTGLVNYDTVYPPVTVSSSSSSYSGSSTTISGKAVYGASSTCTQTENSITKGQSGNTRLDTYAEGWSEALAKQGLIGKTWIGVMDHNGKTDSTGLTTTGRLTIIFAPCTTNLANPVEIMYYWHGIKGFSYTTTGTTFNDFNERMAPQSKSMSMAGRNFVLVFPEMPWSGGDKGMYSSRNTGSRSTAVWSGDDGLVSMHSEALGYIRSFNMGTPSVSLISIVGHSKGGHPLYLAANNGQLAQLAPGKITLSDADYWKSSKAVWDEYVKSNSNVELNLIAQHQDNGGAHDPTFWTLKFLTGLDDPVTSTWTVSGSVSDNTWNNKAASTPGASRGEVYTLTKYSNINYYPHEGGHSDIGAMSLSFVAPSRSTSVSNIGDCPISSGSSESVGSTSVGTLTGSVPILSNAYLASHSINDDSGQGHHWGTIELVNMLEKAACDTYPYTQTKLTVQDLSESSGGDIIGHASHESGRDADTGIYYYENGQVKNLNTAMCTKGDCNSDGLCKCTSAPFEKFNHDSALEANYRYIKSLNTHADIRFILFDKKLMDALDSYAQRMYGESDFSSTHKVQHAVNHYHHFHIRIDCPEGDTRCSN